MLLFTVFFLALMSSSAFGNSDSRCIPLRRCESVQWLIVNLSRLSADKRSTVVRQINRMQCGMNEQSEMLILCPKTISNSLIEDQEERGVFGSRNNLNDCIGSIKVKYFNIIFIIGKVYCCFC